jgi:flagellin
MSSIVTNVAALNAQRNLGVTGLKMGKVFEKLSSGYRINRAADDAAGLGISEKMRAQVRGNTQAIRNAQDGISMIQTAEGAMDEVHSILQRMRELSVQAANDTYDTAARDSIATEINQLRTEIDRIANGTQFNGQQLLTGNLGSTPASVTGGNINAGDIVAATKVAPANVATDHADGETLADSGDSGTGATFTLDANAQALLPTGNGVFGGVVGAATLTVGGVVMTATTALSGAAGAQSVVFSGTVNGSTVTTTLAYTNVDLTAGETLNALTAKNLVLGNDPAAQAAVQQVTASSTTLGGTYTLSAVNGNPTQLSVSDGVNPAYIVTASALSAGSNTLTLGGTGITLTMTAGAAVSAATVVNDLTKAGQNQIVVTGATGGANLQVGANVSTFDEMNISFNDVRASQATGLNLINQNVTQVMAPAITATVAVDFGTIAGINGIVGSNDRAQALVYVMDQSIQVLNNRRATLGAAQNRLEHTVNSLGVGVENLTASESRIRDADVASLSSQLVSSQILQQAGTAVLAQANQASQSVLSLLK